MKKLLIAFLLAAGVAHGAFKTDQVTVTGLAPGGCVTATSSGLLTTNGSSCGGGGASSLAISQNGVAVSSPTSVVNFLSPLIASFSGGTTAQVTIDTSSANGVLIISSATTNFITQSSATANYLTLSSATATYLNKLSVYVASVTGNAAVTISGTNNAAAAAPIFSLNSSSVTLQGRLSASAPLTLISGAFGVDSSSVTLLGPSIALGTETTGIYVGSVTVTNALTLAGSNNAASAAPILGVNASSVAVLSAGLIQNSQIDGSSVTKQGLLVAGSNITLTPGAGILTIAASSSGGGSALTVTTGTVSAYSSPPVSSAATAIIFDSNTFTSQLMAGTSVFVSLNFGSSNGTIFSMTTSSSVTNSSAETNVVGAGSGNITLPANYLQVGKTLRVKASGLYTSTTTTPGVFTFKFKLGTTVIVSTASLPLVASQVNQLWSFGVALTVRSAGASGTVFANTAFGMYDTTNGWRTFPMTMTAATTVDTTASQQIGITAQFGTASSSNSFTTTNFVVVGETITTVGGVSGGSATPSGPLSSVQYSSGSTLGGDTGFQYDATVSSVTINGRLGIWPGGVSSGDSIRFLEDSSGVPRMSLYPNAAGDTGVLSWVDSSDGVERVRMLGLGSSGLGLRVLVSTTQTNNAIERLKISNQNDGGLIQFTGKTLFRDLSSNGMVQFDPVGNSSFTIPVYLSTITINKQLKDVTGSAGSLTNVLTVGANGPTWQAAAASAKFVWTPSILSFKLLSPGTTNFPKVDNSTTTGQMSLYWDSITTQTVSSQKVLRPYNSGTFAFDFYFTGSSVTTGNVSWGYQAICTGPTRNVNVNTIWQGYSIAASTSGVIPATAGLPYRFSISGQSVSCSEGDRLNVLFTRNHNVASDAVGDIRLLDVAIREE